MTKPICFSASRISQLLAGGTGKTRLNYIFELAEKSIGIDNSITTAAMLHGITSELDALNVLFNHLGDGYLNSDGNGGQLWFPINKTVGATPDALSDGWVGDAKCNYYIHTFFEQVDKLPKSYYDQIQCQMMALKVDKGYLINYLTKPETYGQDDWIEYEFELKDRYHIHEIEPDTMVQNDILVYSDKWFPYIGICSEMMQSAKELNHEDFFMMQFKDKVRFQKLKEVNWIENTKQIFRFENNFYITKNKK